MLRMSSLNGSRHFVVSVTAEIRLYLGFGILHSQNVEGQYHAPGGGRGFFSSPRQMRPLQPLHLEMFPWTKHTANGSPTAGLELHVATEIRGGGDPKESCLGS